ncbi:hypothetical protein CXF85_06405 [Colwellia sp. 75C3]|uniref:hypothetical protein n=1 Tax=Colwellia sp. 75C3 TaxID=888425 RepID=UPI000C323CA4|nr:hypothetical protein [Colwellia sp. 75C3]PKG85221.1 hypothetical protein CXF85_06405 [Colwellia sp. 75C3]
MKKINTLLLATTVVVTTFFITSCENTHVSGSVSYGMGYGTGYPMYYGNSYHRHSSVVVVKPARKHRSRPSNTQSRPARAKRR